MLFIDPSHEDYFKSFWNQTEEEEKLLAGHAARKEMNKDWIEKETEDIEDDNDRNSLQEKLFKRSYELELNVKLEIEEIEGNTLYADLNLPSLSSSIKSAVLYNDIPTDLSDMALENFKYEELIKLGMNDKEAKEQATVVVKEMDLEERRKISLMAQQILNKGQKTISKSRSSVSAFKMGKDGNYKDDEFPEYNLFHYIHQKKPKWIVKIFKELINKKQKLLKNSALLEKK